MNFDFESAINAFNSMSNDDIAQFNAESDSYHQKQFHSFKEFYDRGECYLCEKSFKTISMENPCVHFLLRRGKFKKKDFPGIYKKFGYYNIAAFLRWCANREKNLSNINDLEEETPERKVFSYTIKWKNIEWSFDCAKNDLEGHKGSHIDFPHYHFQMRIDGKQFINFNEYHIPFSAYDLLIKKLGSRSKIGFNFDFGAAGAGMKQAMEIDPEDILQYSSPSESEGEATYHLSTIIHSPDRPIMGEELLEMLEESKRSGKTIAAIAKERFSEKANVQVNISPSEHIAQVAGRTEHKRR
jgi:hypothetical protein